MTKQKILTLIPLIIITILMILCWTTIITTNSAATWQHYIGLGLFIVLATLHIRWEKAAVLTTGLFLLIASFNGLAMTSTITTSQLGIGPIVTPPIQLLSLGIFILYVALNFNGLADMYLDYKEGKAQSV